MTPASKRLARHLRRTRRSLDLGLILRFQVRALSPLLFAVGAWFLLRARLLPETPPAYGIAVAAALGASLLVALFRWFPRRWTPELCAQEVDRELQAGGLLLALQEIPDERWAPFVSWKSEHRPRSGLSPRELLPLIPGALFTLLSLAVPVPRNEAEPARAVGRSLVSELETKMQDLEARGLLREESRDRLRSELDRLGKSIEGGSFGGSQWETIEAIRKRLSGEEARGHEQIEKLMGKLAEAGLLDPERLRKMDDETAKRMADTALEAAEEFGIELPKLGRGLISGTLQRFIKSAHAGDFESLRKGAETTARLLDGEFSMLVPDRLRGFLRPGSASSLVKRASGLLERTVRPKAPEPPRNPVIEQNETPGDLVHRSQLRPRHRGVVGRYFSER